MLCIGYGHATYILLEWVFDFCFHITVAPPRGILCTLWPVKVCRISRSLWLALPWLFFLGNSRSHQCISSPLILHPCNVDHSLVLPSSTSISQALGKRVLLHSIVVSYLAKSTGWSKSSHGKMRLTFGIKFINNNILLSTISLFASYTFTSFFQYRQM